jgi:geranylgeranyl diphosphate synthase type II
VIAAAAGCEGMIGGQMADIGSEGNRIALSRLEQLHMMKTGALINAAITTGAILGGATSEQIRHLHKYAQNIGLAFQIIDDILNVEGDPALLGKAVGTDEEKKKSTYPALLGLVESRKLAASRVKEALQALEYFDKKADPLRAIAKYVIDRKR